MNWVILFILNRIYQTPLLLSVYKVLKYIIHATTQTSEIYRLCNPTIVGSRQLVQEEPVEEEKDFVVEYVSKDIVYRIDKSIFYSTQLSEEKHQLQQQSCQLDIVLKSITAKKQFPKNGSIKTHAAQVLLASLKRIYEANQLLHEIEQQVTTKYDTDNELHEEKLLQLWSKMMPNTELESRLTKQWVEIGFQGNDPATDFRGMGIQGLNDLLYFVQTHPDHALSALQHASHPVSWYPYAIVGINITKFAYQVLESKKLQLYLFKYGASIATFQEFYCYLYYQFNQFWIHHQPVITVMDFEAKFIEFKNQIEKDLLLEKVKPLNQFIVTTVEGKKKNSSL